MTNHSTVPDFVPTLSPGRHRNPRKGACFMEMASYLAGERWSDHPNCTHPLLAALARDVNDRLGDDARQELVSLVPSVVGLTGEEPRIGPWIARESALAALPVAAMPRQRALAVGLLRAEAVLADLDGLPPGWLSPRAADTLKAVPGAERWARDFIATAAGRRDAFVARGAPAVVHQAVAGLAEACAPHRADMLVALLRRTISALQRLTGAVSGRELSRVNAVPVSVEAPDGLRGAGSVRGQWRDVTGSSVSWDGAAQIG
jgi:hypothetical protein